MGKAGETGKAGKAGETDEAGEAGGSGDDLELNLHGNVASTFVPGEPQVESPSKPMTLEEKEAAAARLEKEMDEMMELRRLENIERDKEKKRSVVTC